LTAEEAHLCDIEEELENGYYEKIVIPVVQVNGDGTRKKLSAFVYRMTP
jgi:hypothetical protein